MWVIRKELRSGTGFGQPVPAAKEILGETLMFPPCLFVSRITQKLNRFPWNFMEGWDVGKRTHSNLTPKNLNYAATCHRFNAYLLLKFHYDLNTCIWETLSKALMSKCEPTWRGTVVFDKVISEVVILRKTSLALMKGLSEYFYRATFVTRLNVINQRQYLPLPRRLCFHYHLSVRQKDYSETTEMILWHFMEGWGSTHGWTWIKGQVQEYFFAFF